MNIFILSKDIKKSVSYYVDKHVIKILLEVSQLLCSVHHMNGKQAPYKLTHKNHPIGIWARSSLSNYNYLCSLGMELSHEYTYRFGKIHKSQQVVEWCIENKPSIQNKGLTSFYLAMPEEYRCLCPIESYREYYRREKNHLFKWTRREKPYWIDG